MSHEEYYEINKKIKNLREMIFKNSLNNLIKVLKKINFYEAVKKK